MSRYIDVIYTILTIFLGTSMVILDWNWRSPPDMTGAHRFFRDHSREINFWGRLVDISIGHIDLLRCLWKIDDFDREWNWLVSIRGWRCVASIAGTHQFPNRSYPNRFFAIFYGKPMVSWNWDHFDFNQCRKEGTHPTRLDLFLILQN